MWLADNFTREKNIIQGEVNYFCENGWNLLFEI